MMGELFVPASCRVYTPEVLASAMVDACRVGSSQQWLEPSFGGGIFIEQLSLKGVPKTAITGLELDASKTDQQDLCEAHVGVDAISWLESSHRLFDVVIGNPPYARLSSISPDIRKAAAATGVLAGLPRLRGTANLWIAFVYASLSALKPGGTICFVLPAAFEHATYASALRDALPELFGEVLVLRSRKPMFLKVQEGCVVLLARRYKMPTVNGRITRVECADLNAVCEALKDKHEYSPRVARRTPRTIGRLGDFATVRLGGVTGDVRYFVLCESRRRQLRLPQSSVVPVVSRARHLSVPIFGRKHWLRLCLEDEPVWLFRPSAQALRSKYVQEYLDHGLAGGCNVKGYKISNRDPWYETPLPGRVDAFVSGLSGSRPKVCVSGMRDLSATNTLFALCFNSNRICRYAISASFGTSVVREQVESKLRLYASGLNKLEPSDLLSLELPCPRPNVNFRTVHSKFYAESHDVDRFFFM